jgi:hypothetical protein
MPIMNRLLAIFLFTFSSYFLMGQGGAQVFTGLTSLTNSNESITEAGHMHSGFTIGIQSRLKDGSFVAGPGLKYTRFNMMSEKGADFFGGGENYHLLSMPFNIGLEYRLAYILKLRLYTGADAHYFFKIDDNQRDINFDYVNDYFFGAHAGIGIDLYWVTIDLMYERGLSNAHKFDDSKYSGLTFAVGFFF